MMSQPQHPEYREEGGADDHGGARRFDYLDFDLLIEQSGQGFSARVVASPSGPTDPVPFSAPFSEHEVEAFLEKIGHPRQVPVRSAASSEDATIKEFGGTLFDAVFRDDIQAAWVRSFEQAAGRRNGLRLRLRLADCPTLKA
jgi:hypothetical protein